MKLNPSFLIFLLLSITGAQAAFEEKPFDSVVHHKVSGSRLFGGQTVTSKIKDEACFAKIKSVLIECFGPHVGPKLFELPLKPEAQEPTWPTVHNFSCHFMPKAIAEVQSKFETHLASVPCLIDQDGSFSEQLRHCYLGYLSEGQAEINWILRLKNVSIAQQYVEMRAQTLIQIVDSLIEQYKAGITAEEAK